MKIKIMLMSVAAAFSAMMMAGCSPANVVIPDGVTNIEDNAFEGDTNLASVTILNSETKFGS